MVELLRTSCEEGGLGFSSTLSITHNDAEGQPVPSRHASRAEFVALAGAIMHCFISYVKILSLFLCQCLFFF